MRPELNEIEEWWAVGELGCKPSGRLLRYGRASHIALPASCTSMEGKQRPKAIRSIAVKNILLLYYFSEDLFGVQSLVWHLVTCLLVVLSNLKANPYRR